MKQYKPRDATTNPTLILQACAQPQYEPLINEAIQSALASSPRLTTESSDAEINEAVSLTMDELLVTFGSKILEILPSNGRVRYAITGFILLSNGAYKRSKLIICTVTLT